MNDLISKLSEIRSEYNCFNQDEEPYYRALSEVISILSRRTDGDTISRQAAINSPVKMIAQGLDWVPVYHIEQLPFAERHGQWEDIEHAPNGLLYATCSVCGKRQTIESVNYCGECGARMDGEAK